MTHLSDQIDQISSNCSTLHRLTHSFLLQKYHFLCLVLIRPKTATVCWSTMFASGSEWVGQTDSTSTEVVLQTSWLNVQHTLCFKFIKALLRGLCILIHSKTTNQEWINQLTLSRFTPAFVCWCCCCCCCWCCCVCTRELAVEVPNGVSSMNGPVQRENWLGCTFPKCIFCKCVFAKYIQHWELVKSLSLSGAAN